MEMTVENNNGQTLGKLEDLVFDLPSGQVRFAVIASGGFVGIGTRFNVVPAQLVSAATALRNTVVMDVSILRWRQAPVFKRSELSALSESDRAERIARFFGTKPEKRSLGPRSSPGGEQLPATGRHFWSFRRASPESKTLVLASTIIGTGVVDRRQEKLGEILELLMQFKPTPAFAVFSSGRYFEGREREFAASLRALSYQTNGRIMVDADRAALEAAPAFVEASRGPSLAGAPVVFRY
jgi:hypothetical protein